MRKLCLLALVAALTGCSAFAKGGSLGSDLRVDVAGSAGNAFVTVGSPECGPIVEAVGTVHRDAALCAGLKTGVKYLGGVLDAVETAK
jgi:hypothetical protein